MLPINSYGTEIIKLFREYVYICKFVVRNPRHVYYVQDGGLMAHTSMQYKDGSFLLAISPEWLKLKTKPVNSNYALLTFYELILHYFLNCIVACATVTRPTFDQVWSIAIL